MKAPTKPKRKYARRRKPPVEITSSVPDPIPDRHKPLIGYVRVSMSDQSNQRQIDELVKFGVPKKHIFADTASGRNMDRQGWIDCWRQLDEGHTLVVHSLDRLGRNLEEVIKIERELRERGVALKVLAQDINTSTAAGRLIFHILLTVAQFEREWSLERTLHGLQKARERGKAGGRQKMFADEDVARAVKEHGGINAAAKALRCSKATVIRAMQRVGPVKPDVTLGALAEAEEAEQRGKGKR